MQTGSKIKAALIFFAILFAICTARADERGSQVLVLFNKNVQESEDVARHYAQKRSVPDSQVVGLALPETEQISRGDFADKLQRPLWELCLEKKFFEFPNNVAGQTPPSASKIRYLALCYGVPLKIAGDKRINDDAAAKLPVELRRNEAAVDSELSLLPLYSGKMPLSGLVQNPAAGATNQAMLHPTNGVLMVARLDGPTAAIAKGLVDKALEAELKGLWGRAYFDLRGLTNSGYELGDRWLGLAAEMTKGFGFETTLDTAASTFHASTPMSHIALYFGWYDSVISGPFLVRAPEFVPGAIAYHLYSFSAASIRALDKHWVAPLLARGITATVGYTDEPYLQFTMEVPVFTQRLLFRSFTFGEAAYAAQQFLSWQTTVVGDPLYRPFADTSAEYYGKLINQEGEPGDWALALQVNRNLFMQPQAATQLAGDLEGMQRTMKSSVLQEKIGDLYKSKGRLKDAIDPYLAALKLNPSPQQRLRITLNVAFVLKTFGRAQEAYDLYKGLLTDYPEYAGRSSIYEKLAPIAEGLGKKEEAAEYRRLAKG